MPREKKRGRNKQKGEGRRKEEKFSLTFTFSAPHDKKKPTSSFVHLFSLFPSLQTRAAKPKRRKRREAFPSPPHTTFLFPFPSPCHPPSASSFLHIFQFFIILPTGWQQGKERRARLICRNLNASRQFESCLVPFFHEQLFFTRPRVPIVFGENSSIISRQPKSKLRKLWCGNTKRKKILQLFNIILFTLCQIPHTLELLSATMDPPQQPAKWGKKGEEEEERSRKRLIRLSYEQQQQQQPQQQPLTMCDQETRSTTRRIPHFFARELHRVRACVYCAVRVPD